MTIFDMEHNRLRQQEIELKALTALARFGNHVQRFEALKHLEHIAYPQELAEKINYKRRVQRDYFGNCMTCGTTSEECKCHE
tara:strand:- start:350 stop:595 length:246 start_codon:yes stop_codon:yes gene_type:complete